MKFPISFNYSSSFLHLLFYSFCYLIQIIIMHYYEEINQSQISKMFMMYFAESLSIIFYLREKNKINEKFINEYFVIRQSNYKIKIIFVLFWVSTLDLIGSIYYDSAYNYGMKKINSELVKYLKNTFNGLFIFFNEYIYLKIKTNLHQNVGIVIYIFCLLVTLLNNLLNIHYKNYSLISFFLLFIIIIQSKYLQSFINIIEKNLNYEYYINIHFICFMEGIIGFIIVFIFDFFYVFIFRMDEKFIYKIEVTKKHSFSFFIILPIYIVTIYIYNISRLKMIEKERPSYIILGKSISNLLASFFNIIIGKQNPFKDNYIEILNTVLSILGCLIFSEIMILHFCNLDKNTTNKTFKRGQIEIEKMLGGDTSTILNDTMNKMDESEIN